LRGSRFRNFPTRTLEENPWKGRKNRFFPAPPQKIPLPFRGGHLERPDPLKDPRDRDPAPGPPCPPLSRNTPENVFPPPQPRKSFSPLRGGTNRALTKVPRFPPEKAFSPVGKKKPPAPGAPPGSPPPVPDPLTFGKTKKTSNRAPLPSKFLCRRPYQKSPQARFFFFRPPRKRPKPFPPLGVPFPLPCPPPRGPKPSPKKPGPHPRPIFPPQKTKKRIGFAKAGPPLPPPLSARPAYSPMPPLRRGPHSFFFFFPGPRKNQVLRIQPRNSALPEKPARRAPLPPLRVPPPPLSPTP